MKRSANILTLFFRPRFFFLHKRVVLKVKVLTFSPKNGNDDKFPYVFERFKKSRRERNSNQFEQRTWNEEKSFLSLLFLRFRSEEKRKNSFFFKLGQYKQSEKTSRTCRIAILNNVFSKRAQKNRCAVGEKEKKEASLSKTYLYSQVRTTRKRSLLFFLGRTTVSVQHLFVRCILIKYQIEWSRFRKNSKNKWKEKGIESPS